MESGFQRIRCRVAYDGTGFSGWQIQPRGVTVQAKIEEGLARVLQQPVRIHASGRTDTGVHARGQVFHCDVPKDRDVSKLLYGVNCLLPFDIRLLDVEVVQDNFHARFDVVRKEYRYFICADLVLLPFDRLYRYRVRVDLDVERMRQAAALLEGEHDFASFSANPNREVESTVRTLHVLSVLEEGSDVVVCAEGNGFLYKMVRGLVGFLVEVGRGELAPEDALVLLEERERTCKVPTAPAEGLFLWKVSY